MTSVAGRDGAGERLGDGHLADVGVDRAIEGHVFGQRVDEHQRVVDMGPDDGLLGAGLGKAHATFGRRLELAAEDAFWEKAFEKAEHGTRGCSLHS